MNDIQHGITTPFSPRSPSPGSSSYSQRSPNTMDDIQHGITTPFSPRAPSSRSSSYSSTSPSSRSSSFSSDTIPFHVPPRSYKKSDNLFKKSDHSQASRAHAPTRNTVQPITNAGPLSQQSLKRNRETFEASEESIPPSTSVTLSDVKELMAAYKNVEEAELANKKARLDARKADYIENARQRLDQLCMKRCRPEIRRRQQHENRLKEKLWDVVDDANYCERRLAELRCRRRKELAERWVDVNSEGVPMAMVQGTYCHTSQESEEDELEEHLDVYDEGIYKLETILRHNRSELDALSKTETDEREVLEDMLRRLICPV